MERNQHGPPYCFNMFYIKKKFNFYFYFFIIFLFFLLFQSFIDAYYYKISAFISFIPFEAKATINPILWSENGLVETIQHLFLLITIFLILNFTFTHKKKNLPLTFFSIIYLLGLSYYFFEEISWGQHFFNWETPEFFLRYNHQKETNFHNISNFLNETPRSLLIIWCSFSFLIARYFDKFTNLKEFKNFIYPNNNLRKISYLILFFFIPDFFVDKLNLHPGYPIISGDLEWLKEFRLFEFIDLITFNYIRLSELHELLIDYYILTHAYLLVSSNIFKFKN